MHTDDPSNLRRTLADFVQRGYFVPLRLGQLSILLHKLLFVGRVKRQRKYTGWPLFFHTTRKVHLEVESTKYGDMDLADAKRLKELEKENSELKKMVAESMLKIRVLEEVNAKKF